MVRVLRDPAPPGPDDLAALAAMTRAQVGRLDEATRQRRRDVLLADQTPVWMHDIAVMCGRINPDGTISIHSVQTWRVAEKLNAKRPPGSQPKPVLPDPVLPHGTPFWYAGDIRRWTQHNLLTDVDLFPQHRPAGRPPTRTQPSVVKVGAGR